MIWLWERDGQRLTYEVRRLGEDNHYELLVTYPDGTEEAETFAEPAALLDRSFDWKDRLESEGWHALLPW